MRKVIKKFLIHIERWNKWRKYSMMSRKYKLLVLVWLAHSPTFAITLTDAELKSIKNTMDRSLALGYLVHKEVEVTPGKWKQVCEKCPSTMWTAAPEED